MHKKIEIGKLLKRWHFILFLEEEIQKFRLVKYLSIFIHTFLRLTKTEDFSQLKYALYVDLMSWAVNDDDDRKSRSKIHQVPI